jgi:hypothetical protein
MIHINAPELARFRVAANSIDRRVIPQVRKSIRNLGADAVGEVQKTVRGAGGESADAIARGTSLRVSFAKSGAGVKITTTNAALPADHKGFVAPFNKPSFRHPVYGNKAAWVTQSGRPYFGSVIARVFDEKVEKEMVEVFKTAVRGIGGRV